MRFVEIPDTAGTWVRYCLWSKKYQNVEHFVITETGIALARCPNYPFKMQMDAIWCGPLPAYNNEVITERRI